MTLPLNNSQSSCISYMLKRFDENYMNTDKYIHVFSKVSDVTFTASNKYTCTSWCAIHCWRHEMVWVI